MLVQPWQWLSGAYRGETTSSGLSFLGRTRRSRVLSRGIGRLGRDVRIPDLQTSLSIRASNDDQKFIQSMVGGGGGRACHVPPWHPIIFQALWLKYCSLTRLDDMLELIQRHIAVGGNRQTAAADWKEDLFAFGSGKNVALWQPQNFQGVNALLRGHTDDVSAVRILSREGESPVIVSGSADKTVRLWSFQDGKFTETFQSQHEGAVNAIAVLPGSDMFVTGAADATLKVWQLEDHPSAEATVG